MVSLQLLLHFSCDFYQTFTDWRPYSDAAHIVDLLQFDHFWKSYCPLFILHLKLVSSQLLLHFSCDLYQTFTDWWPYSDAAHIVGLSGFDHFWKSYCPFLILHISYVSEKLPLLLLLGFRDKKSPHEAGDIAVCDRSCSNLYS